MMMIGTVVRMRKFSLSHSSNNTENDIVASKRMNTLSIECEHGNLEDSDVSSTKDLIFETES